MKLTIKFLTPIFILLSAFALANAQNTEQSPMDRVLAELQAGRTEQAFAALDEVIKQDPKNPDAYLLRGSLKMQVDPAQALSDFNKVIELKPDAGVAYNQRAFIRLMNNDTAGAVKDLDAAIKHNYKDDSIYDLRAQLRWQTGDLNGARSDLDEAIRLNPNNARAYSTRGQLLVALKDPERAMADFNYLLNWYETDPDTVRPVPKPPDAKDAKSPSKPGEAPGFLPSVRIEIAQQTANVAPGAKEMAPTIASTYVNRGMILSSRGNHVAALADFEKAIRVDPANVWGLYYRANEYEYKGNLAAALADISKAIQMEPKNGNLVVERGVILVLMGKEKEAQADFDMLLQSDRALWQKRIDDRTAAVRKILPSN
jgi:tetratricopeptide (TPR) repeat protein